MGFGLLGFEEFGGGDAEGEPLCGGGVFEGDGFEECTGTERCLLVFLTLCVTNVVYRYSLISSWVALAEATTW